MIRTNGKPDASVERDPERRARRRRAHHGARGGFAARDETRCEARGQHRPGLRAHDPYAARKPADQGARLDRDRAHDDRGRAALRAPRNSRAYGDPRSRIYIEDAKTFFAAGGKRYDIIVSEPSNPWVSGVSTLFSEEFYGQVKRYLKDDGLLVQWVQAYEINVGLLSTIFQALGKHFGDYTVTARARTCSSSRRRERSSRAFRRVFELPGVRDEPSPTSATRSWATCRCCAWRGAKTPEPHVRAAGLPGQLGLLSILDQRAPRARFKMQDAGDLAQMRSSLVPALAFLDGEWRTPLERIMRVGKTAPSGSTSWCWVPRPSAWRSAEQSRARDSCCPATAALARHALMDNCTGRRPSGWIRSPAWRASPSRSSKRRTWRSCSTRQRLALRPLARRDERAAPRAAAGDQRARCRSDGEARRRRLAKLARSDGKRSWYYLTVAMTGHLARGRFAESAGLERAPRPRLTPPVAAALVMRLLDAHAVSGPVP